MKKLILLILIAVPFVSLSQVDLSYYLPKDISYDAKIPTPKQYLGYELGEQHVTPYEIHGYYRELAKHSDRMKIETYARSYEHRELLMVTVSSPQNLQNLANIQAEHAKLAYPAQSKNLDLNKMPAVVWMGYSVHGNEASGANSSLLTIYHLIAGNSPKIDSILNETIILIDPCINPDGGNRFATWVNQKKSKNLVSDPESSEYNETWPNGRTNHYWFDMNRDWLYQQLPESKGRLVKFYEWLPNILTDHHEMGPGSTFFFQPGIPERTHPMTPVKNIELTSKFGRFQAAGLDKIGSLYYTKENYDDFYYGKGSTLPDANGSLGILFEQASSRGHVQETRNGTLTFPFTIRNQFTATQSTLQASKDMRVELLNYMRDFYAEKANYDEKAYVFGMAKDPIATWETVNVLLRNNIEVYKLSRNEKVDGQNFDASNSYVVPLNQPRHRLIKSLFEKRTTFADSAFYDVSAWTLPICMNVPYASSANNLNLGEKVTQNDFPEGRVVGNSNYAYLLEWDGYFAPKAAYELMKNGYRLKYAMAPFSTNQEGQKKEFSYGTVLILCEGKDPKPLLETIAKRDGLIFYAQPTGLTLSGINLGSEKFKPFDKIHPAMITGEGVDANDAGEVWHLLDQRIDLPLVHLDISDINGLDLSKYSHLIINNGRYNKLNADKIKSYIQSGGIVIALGRGAEWLAQQNISKAKVKQVASSTSSEKRPYATKSLYVGALATSGAILNTHIDPTHPLCFGYNQDDLAIFKVNNIVFEDTGDPYNTPLLFTANPLIAGYVHPKNLERFKDSPAIITENLGSGRIISISDNPNFRAFWYGTNKLFLNSLFFGSSIGSGRYED